MMRSLARLVALGASALLAAGALAAPANGTATADSTGKAAGERFNFVASAYGTRVFNPEGDLVDSGRTAWSFVACTSKTGKDKTDHLAKVDLPGDLLEVGPVTTRSRSVKLARGVKSVANTKVGDIRLGAEGLGSLHIEGLSGTSESRHKNGTYDQRGTMSLLSIKVKGSLGLPLPVPFDPDDIDPGQELTVPGLAKLRFLDTKGGARANRSWNNTVALEIEVLAPLGPLAGQTVRIGSARTELEGISKNGMVNGYGQAARAELLDGVVSSGRIAHQPLPCTGTDGTWKKNSVAGVNAGPIRLGAANGAARGVAEPGSRPLAHTRASIADAQLTSALKIGAVKSEAKVVRAKENGKVVYRRSSDVSVLDVRAGGTNYTKALNKAIEKQRSLEIPGIAKITPNVVDRGKRSIEVTALKITLLDVAEPLSSSIYLATSKAKILR